MATQNPHPKKWPKYSERVKGDGSISRFVYPTVNGKPCWRRIPNDPEWRGKKGYERFLQKVITEESTASADTFAAVSEKWLKQYQNGKYSTHKSHKITIEKHLAPRFGKLKCRDIKSSVIQEFISDMLITHGPNTVKSTVAVLKGILETLVVDERLPRNAARAKFRYITDKTPTEGRALTVDEFKLLQSHVKVVKMPLEDLLLALEVAIETGLRTSELLAMKWKYLDTGNLNYSVEEQLGTCSDPNQFVAPKSEASQGTVEIRPALMRKLLAHKTSQAKRRLAATNWVDHNLLFCRDDGTPVNRQLLYQWVSRAGKRAGLGRVTPHDLRHTCASLLISGGVSIEKVSRQLRHATISMTWDVYGHLYPQDLDAITQAMDQIFG